jgi:hypothetical protein
MLITLTLVGSIAGVHERSSCLLLFVALEEGRGYARRR